MGFMKEFKEFALRGNVIDMAVGVVIGAAFGNIVTSIVDDIFTPIIGMIVGGIDFSGIAIKLGDASINIGHFIQVVINFIIVALCLFLVIKAMNKLKKPAPAKAPRLCPYCKSEVADDATRCPHCTSELKK